MKKELVKRISLISAMAIAASSLAGCGSSGSESQEASTLPTTAGTTATMPEEHAQIVEQVELNVDKLENGTLKWLSFWDINPTEGKPVPVSLQLFQTKYGGTIEYIPTTWETRYNDLATLVLGGQSPDMFPASDLDIFPGKVSAGMFEPMDDYVDFNSDAWGEGCKSINEMNSINGKHYLSCVYTNTGFVMIYNKKTIEANGLEDPAELAYNNEWTWSKFKDMCYAFADREQDKYAVGGWWYEPAMILSTGKPIIGMENGKIVNNLMSTELERVENLFREMKLADVMFPYSEYDWNDFPERVSEGKTLFYPVGRWKLLEPDLSAFGDPDDIMFAPMPRDENADAWYLSATGGVDAYALCKGATNPEAVAAYVNCKLIEKNDESVQEVNEAEMREDYHWTDEMIAMDNYISQLTNEHPMVDFYTSVNSDVYDLLFNPVKDASYNGTDWYSTRDSLNDAVQVYIDEMNETLANLN